MTDDGRDSSSTGSPENRRRRPRSNFRGKRKTQRKNYRVTHSLSPGRQNVTDLYIILQLYAGVTAYQFGPYPDVQTCERLAPAIVAELKTRHDVLAAHTDCRLIYPEIEN